MSNNASQQELHVSFEFPGASEVITIHIDRAIGMKDDVSDRYSHSMAPELELTLANVPGLELNSVWTHVNKYSVTTECALAFSRDELCLNIAIALAEYFGVDDQNIHILKVIDNRPLRNLMHR